MNVNIRAALPCCALRVGWLHKHRTSANSPLHSSRHQLSTGGYRTAPVVEATSGAPLGVLDVLALMRLVLPTQATRAQGAAPSPAPSWAEGVVAHARSTQLR